MIQSLFLRYGTDRDWEACQRRKPRKIQEDTNRRDQERTSAKGRRTRTRAEPERCRGWRKTWTASVLDKLCGLMRAGNVDIADQDKWLNVLGI